MQLNINQIPFNTLPDRPGVYQFFDKNGQWLYVGKARSLKKRIANYFQGTQDRKTQLLMLQADSLRITLTATENEALLLESNLIKAHKPRYNILLRDDKSYPYLYCSTQDDFPRLDLHRGHQTHKKGRYFGPFPSVSAVRDTLTLVQKLFKIRQCRETFFKNRTRPCLQYQIKRCTAPCVGYIDKAAYRSAVNDVILFLTGKSNEIIDELVAKMETAADRLDYELAAKYRDEITQIRQVQSKQHMTVGTGDVDIIAIAERAGIACVNVLTVRHGRLLGSKAYFPEIKHREAPEEVLSAFLPQYYLHPNRGESLPNRVVITLEVLEANWIAAALSDQLAHGLVITSSVRGHYKQWQQMAEQNAEHSLSARLAHQAHFGTRLLAMQAALKLPSLPQQIDCFDISHTQGEACMASCVVFNEQGPDTRAYRRFSIHEITPGDDYAAMEQALRRRYQRLKTDNQPLPDVLIVDGGKGQLQRAKTVLEDLQLSGIVLLGIAKGAARKPGDETLFLGEGKTVLELPADSPALHLIQHIRDEAHRFAITGHRRQRDASRTTSVLEGVPGIGRERRRTLLNQFGGLQAIKQASVEDLACVPGISERLAKLIYTHLQKK